ncbi:hypothetical protein [Poritiphilus flavus]|uniref:Uncharacterized protein n=1 Tax=Poritiphilus flavus TaxID=2697053 RepID=A0A6L9E961_9FLAO|nr:hypothetical protein [Poritiphilus flavus]NAS11256.1 hypothetical protein [Poritiphilus flavus]
MRKFSVLLITVMLLSAVSMNANIVKPKPKNPTKSLSAQIENLLDDNNFIVENNELTAKVKFTLNEEKEIVVLTVETDNDQLESFVKSRLNYQKVNLEDYREGKIYRVPVRIVE